MKCKAVPPATSAAPDLIRGLAQINQDPGAQVGAALFEAKASTFEGAGIRVGNGEGLGFE
ncbi:MAG: hypothetical protein WA790_01630 [Sulfitobacter sp.]